MFKGVAPDKWKHFFAGIVMGVVLQSFTSFILKDHLFITTLIVLVLVLVISYGFELVSKITGIGHYDFIDAVATSIGGLLGMGSALIAAIYLFK